MHLDGRLAPLEGEMNKKFNLALSRAIDQINVELEKAKAERNKPIKFRKLLILSKKLRELERKI